MKFELISEFKENACYRLDESMRMIGISLENVSEEQLWQRPNASLNSIGNLLLHLCGNITQYVIASLGETTDERDRDLEFSTLEGFSKQELLSKVRETVEHSKQTILRANNDQFVLKRDVQGFNFSGIGVVLHAVEHFSYHTGQIAFWVKQLTNKDLGFYDGLDLNIHNS